MWIHVPNSYLASAPEPGDSTEASTWRSEMLARSATLNAKEAPSNSWQRAWRKGGWMTHLFGRISTPSTAELGVASFRASLREYPANLIPWPERDSGPTMNATSGLSLQPSFGMFSLDGSSSKTSPESLATTLSASGPSYGLWVSALRRSSSRRRKLGLPTGGNDSSYWPTARVPTGGGESAGRKQELGRWKGGMGTQERHSPDLDKQAEGSFFPLSLPATADVETTGPAGNPDAQPATHGEPSSQSAPTSRRQLNPRFVSWLMGWHPAWTSLALLSFGLPATGSYPNRQPTPFGFSNWPTPDTQNARGGQMRAEAHGKHAVSLHHVIEGWAE